MLADGGQLSITSLNHLNPTAMRLRADRSSLIQQQEASKCDPAGKPQLDSCSCCYVCHQKQLDLTAALAALPTSINSAEVPHTVADLVSKQLALFGVAKTQPLPGTQGDVDRPEHSIKQSVERCFLRKFESTFTSPRSCSQPCMTRLTCSDHEQDEDSCRDESAVREDPCTAPDLSNPAVCVLTLATHPVISEEKAESTNNCNFWQRFEALPQDLQALVLSGLQVPSDRNAARQACRTFRNLLNASTTTLSVPPDFELMLPVVASRFPSALRLGISPEAATLVTNTAFDSICKLTGLETLSLTGCHNLTSDSLLGLSCMVQLECLVLTKCIAVNDYALQPLAALIRLKTLYLDATKVTGTGLTALAGMSFLSFLSMDENEVSHDGLAAVGQLRSLEFLMLNRTTLGGAELAVLTGLSSLCMLKMHYCEMTKDGLAALSPMTWLKRLSFTRYVPDVGYRPLPEAAVWDLSSLSGLETLTATLAFSTSTLRALAPLSNLAELKILAPVSIQQPLRCVFGGLRLLALCRCAMMTDLGLSHLVRALPALQVLYLIESDFISDIGLALLAKVCSKRLERLYLSDLRAVHDMGLASLSAFRGLRELELWYLPHITAHGVEAFMASYPPLRDESPSLAIEACSGITPQHKAALAGRYQRHETRLPRIS